MEYKLKKIKGRVKWIYGNYFKCTKYRESSIKRAGRYWRQGSKKYVRTEIKLQLDNKWKETFQGVFG